MLFGQEVARRLHAFGKTIASGKAEVIEVPPAEMAKWRCRLDCNLRDERSSAARTHRPTERCESRKTVSADGNAAAAIEQFVADSARRGKYKRGERLRRLEESRAHRCDRALHVESRAEYTTTPRSRAEQFAPTAQSPVWERSWSLEEALLVLFLADRAVARPRHRFQALLLQLGLAVGAGTVRIVFVHQEKSQKEQAQQKRIKLAPEKDKN